MCDEVLQKTYNIDSEFAHPTTLFLTSLICQILRSSLC